MINFTGFLNYIMQLDPPPLCNQHAAKAIVDQGKAVCKFFFIHADKYIQCILQPLSSKKNHVKQHKIVHIHMLSCIFFTCAGYISTYDI